MVKLYISYEINYVLKNKDTGGNKKLAFKCLNITITFYSSKLVYLTMQSTLSLYFEY